MTNEELAQHWKISLREVKNISNIINYQYSVELISHGENDTKGWKVVLRANDGKRNYILMEKGNLFSNKELAIIQGTNWAHKIKMTPGQAKLMGVPSDAFLALNPIKGYDKAIKRLYHPTTNIHFSYQRG